MHKDNKHKLPTSQRGVHSITHDLNTFKLSDENLKMRDNNDIYNKIKKWALLNLEELRMHKIANKINDLLKVVILEYASFCQRCKMSHPVKLSSMRRWIEDLNFKYRPNKKSYVINIHELGSILFTCIKILIYI